MLVINISSRGIVKNPVHSLSIRILIGFASPVVLDVISVLVHLNVHHVQMTCSIIEENASISALHKPLKMRTKIALIVTLPVHHALGQNPLNASHATLSKEML